MPVTLAQFAQAQIDAQRLPVKEFARRAGLGLSHAYQILRGERPRAEAATFDAVAKGLGMTPAEMAVAMGKGSDGDNPEEAEFVAILRQVPTEKRSAARDMLLGLTVQPITRGAITRRRDSASTQRSGGRRTHDQHQRLGEDAGAQGGEPTVYRGVRAAFAAFSPTHVLNYLKRLIPAPTSLSPQPAG